MTFSLHQRGVVMSSQIKYTHTVIKIHPLAHILDTWALIFSSCALFSLSQPHHVTASLPSWYHQSMRGLYERTQGQAKMAAWNSFSYICTRALHAFRSLSQSLAAFTVIPLLPTATFTPSIQPNLGLPRTRPPLTSAINTILAKRYSYILSTCPNHLNILWSALLANSISSPALLHTSSFLVFYKIWKKHNAIQLMNSLNKHWVRKFSRSNKC